MPSASTKAARTRAYGQSSARLSTRLAPGGAADRATPMSKADQQRAERLAAALRENLRRRKSQARSVPSHQAEEPGANGPREPSEG